MKHHSAGASRGSQSKLADQRRNKSLNRTAAKNTNLSNKHLSSAAGTASTASSKNSTKNSYELPHFGTKAPTQRVKDTKKTAKNLQEAHEEFKQFSLLKRKDDLNSSQETGTQAFIISQKWMDKYLKFILFDQFKKDTPHSKIKVEQNHFTKNHPGPIQNRKDLAEEDADSQNLFGTGTVKGFESEHIDIYVDSEHSVGDEYIVVNAPLWKFLVERYGGEVIKRFYARMSQYSGLNVESKLKSFRLQLLNTELLNSGKISDSMFKTWYTQVSKTSCMKDVKKRIVDHLACAGYKVMVSDVRLWKYNYNERNSRFL